MNWGEGGEEGGLGYLASVPERSAPCQSCVQAPLASDRKLHSHTHRIDRSDGTAGRARTHTNGHTHVHTPTHSLAASGRFHTGGRRLQEERGSRSNAAPADGGAKPKKRAHRVKEEDWTDEEAISALALPTPLCLAPACPRTRKSEEGGGRRARVYCYGFIHLFIHRFWFN